MNGKLWISFWEGDHFYILSIIEFIENPPIEMGGFLAEDLEKLLK